MLLYFSTRSLYFSAGGCRVQSKSSSQSDCSIVWVSATVSGDYSAHARSLLSDNVSETRRSFPLLSTSKWSR